MLGLAQPSGTDPPSALRQRRSRRRRAWLRLCLASGAVRALIGSPWLSHHGARWEIGRAPGDGGTEVVELTYDYGHPMPTISPGRSPGVFHFLGVARPRGRTLHYYLCGSMNYPASTGPLRTDAPAGTPCRHVWMVAGGRVQAAVDVVTGEYFAVPDNPMENTHGRPWPPSPDTSPRRQIAQIARRGYQDPAPAAATPPAWAKLHGARELDLERMQ
ncbi:MAG: hypothetical protein HYU66_01140 [Armatimonadetes bacterium]|nr:hypothetical protein [Armatimonadota bacterium]